MIAAIFRCVSETAPVLNTQISKYAALGYFIVLIIGVGVYIYLEKRIGK